MTDERGDKADGNGSSAAKLATGAIGRHVFAQTWPLTIGVAAIMSVGIVDAYYIGQLGSAPLAAVAFIFPVTTALSSIGVGVMVGIASVVARALGAGNRDRALALAALGLLLASVVGIAVGSALYLLRAPLFRLLQADAALLPLIDAYMLPYAVGFVIQLAMMGANGVLRAQGAANRSMAILIAYAAANWLLDPVLIHGGFGLGEGFGIAGAAYASVAAFALAAILGLVLLQTSALPLSLAALRSCRLRADAGALARISGPAAVANAINPIGLAVLTALLAGLGQDAVAGYGAAGRIQSFATVPLLGLSGSIGAIVGQNDGAGQRGRVRRALAYSLGFSLVYGIAVAALLFVLRVPLARLFSDAGEVREEFARYLAIAAWGYGGFGVFIVVSGALNAVDRAGVAFLQSVARVLLLMVPVALLLRGALGSSAIYAAELAANLGGAAIAGATAWLVFWRDRTDR